MFDWDENNLRKIKVHRLGADEVEEALSNGPILVYEQDAESESRFVYYGETCRGRLLAICLDRARREGSGDHGVSAARKENDDE